MTLVRISASAYGSHGVPTRRRCCSSECYRTSFRFLKLHIYALIFFNLDVTLPSHFYLLCTYCGIGEESNNIAGTKQVLRLVIGYTYMYRIDKCHNTFILMRLLSYVPICGKISNEKGKNWYTWA